MRMWNVDPKLLCRKHLFGEHLEMHMFSGAIKKGKRLTGFILTGLVELQNIKKRHDLLAEEIVRRGYTHKSPMEKNPTGQQGGTVDVKNSLWELRARCDDCARFQETHRESSASSNN